MMKEDSEFTEKYKQLSTINNIMKEEVMGDESIIDLTEKFFESVQNIATNPEENSHKIISKELFNSLNERANSLNNNLNKYKENLIEEYSMLKKEASNYLDEIENISKEIHNIEALNQYNIDKEYANEVRDQRDLLESKLSKIGNFKVFKNKETKTGDINISEYDTSYSFEFKENGGRLKGIKESITELSLLQNKFNEKYEKMKNKITDFIEGDMKNPNKLLDWYFEKNTTKDLEKISIGFASNVDKIKQHLNSTEIILSNLQEKKEEMSKVNIDEEITNMIKYQKSFEANAKIIKTYDEMFGTLLDMKK